MKPFFLLSELPTPPPPPVHKSDPHDPCISPGRFGLRIGLMHRPTYTPVLCTGSGENFFLRRFPAREASGRKKLRYFSASEASVTLFLLVVYSPGIIFTLLVSKHHPHNSQWCEPVTATLWKTLHPKQSQQPKGVPCWELVLMFDTCTAGIPLSPTLFGLLAALYRRCTKTG